MFDPKMIDDLSQQLASLMPKGLQELRADLQGQARLTLESTLRKMDLVTREEFDAQSRVLARTREKLKRLEARVAELEQTRSSQSPS